MKGGGRIAAAGATFVVLTLGGFGAGVLAGQRTGSALWPIGGLFAGLVLGIASFIALLLRAVR